MSRARLVAALLLTTACTSARSGTDAAAADTTAALATPPADTASRWTLAPDAFGPVHFGMSVAELNAALGDSLKPVYEISDECAQLTPAAFPPGTSLMVLRDTVARLDVHEPGVRTPEGTGIGDSEARLREVYGARAVVTPHKYGGPDDHYVTVLSPMADRRRATLFETVGGQVTTFRAGLAEAVELVEGCA